MVLLQKAMKMITTKNLFTFFLWIAAIPLLYFQITNTKFFQDDYFVLGQLSYGTWGDWVSSVWQYQGGNLWPYGIHALFLSSSLGGVNTSIISVWTIFTVALVTFSNCLILKWFMREDFNVLGRLNLLTIFSISYLGFEGLFTPGLIGAFSYHLASFSHLWPISLLVITFYLIRKGNKNTPLAIMLGLFIGNSNIAESLVALLCFSSILILRKKNIFLVQEFFIINRRFYYSAFSGIVIGFTMILIAPGFWNRANNSVGLPSSTSEFATRFLKSFSSFLADLLTHPMFWLAFLIGVLVKGPTKTGDERTNLISKIRLLSWLGVALFTALTFGSTAAYVSWHQSTGLYQVFIPLSFVIGFYSKTIFNLDLSRQKRILLLIFITITLTAISIRAGLAFEKRASDWNAAFIKNYCLIKNDPKSKLFEATMIYPGFNLGIQDVNDADWMRNGYVNWISNPNFKANIKCSSN